MSLATYRALTCNVRREPMTAMMTLGPKKCKVQATLAALPASPQLMMFQSQKARRAGFESILDLPRIQKSYRKKAFIVTPPVMRICAMSNGEQRVQVLIPVVQGLSQKQRQLMQQYFESVDWQGLKKPRGDNEIAFCF